MTRTRRAILGLIAITLGACGGAWSGTLDQSGANLELKRRGMPPIPPTATDYEGTRSREKSSVGNPYTSYEFRFVCTDLEFADFIKRCPLSDLHDLEVTPAEIAHAFRAGIAGSRFEQRASAKLTSNITATANPGGLATVEISLTRAK